MNHPIASASQKPRAVGAVVRQLAAVMSPPLAAVHPKVLGAALREIAKASSLASAGVDEYAKLALIDTAERLAKRFRVPADECADELVIAAAWNRTIYTEGVAHVRDACATLGAERVSGVIEKFAAGMTECAADSLRRAVEDWSEEQEHGPLLPVTTTRMRWDAYTDPRPDVARTIDQRIERLFRLRRKRASLPADKVMVLFAEAIATCPDVRLDLLAAITVAAWNVDGDLAMRFVDEHASREAICAVHAVVADAAAAGLIEVRQRAWDELCELEAEARAELAQGRDVTPDPEPPATAEPEPPAQETVTPLPAEWHDPNFVPPEGDPWVARIGLPEPVQADDESETAFRHRHTDWRTRQPSKPRVAPSGPIAPFTLSP